MSKITEKQYYSKVAELGCIICKMPAEVHHIRKGAGIGRKSKDIIPLCPLHHRIGGYGVAYHAGRLAFESNFGDEKFLLEKTINLLCNS